MKVTLSNTIKCKLIFRVGGVDPIDERNTGKPIIGIMAYTVYFVKWRKGVSETGNKKREST